MSKTCIRFWYWLISLHGNFMYVTFDLEIHKICCFEPIETKWWGNLIFLVGKKNKNQQSSVKLHLV